MVPEVILSSERLAADVARVGPLVGVGALVYQQIIALGELSTAELANKLFFRARRALLPRSYRSGSRRRRGRRRRGGCVLVHRVHDQTGVAGVDRRRRQVSQRVVVVEERQVLLDLLGEVHVLGETGVVGGGLVGDLRRVGGDLEDVDPGGVVVDVGRHRGQLLEGEVGLQGLQVEGRGGRGVGGQERRLLKRVHHRVLQG